MRDSLLTRKDVRCHALGGSAFHLLILTCLLSYAGSLTHLRAAVHPQWLPLESNPEVVSTFSHRMGASPLWKVVAICYDAPVRAFR